MPSKLLSSLNESGRNELESKLWEAQGQRCFICDKPIDLTLHKGSLELDHIEPLSVGGKDEPNNLALVHMSCNRSKLASDLRVARIMSRFGEIKEKSESLGSNHPNLGDILAVYDGAKFDLSLKTDGQTVCYSLSEIGDNRLLTAPLFMDELSGMQYFFIYLPIEYMFHDDRINPRAIGVNLHKLVEEFFKKRPQLHISLGWVGLDGNAGKVKVKIFDGQHKAAAQVLLGVKKLPIRVFLNPDPELLLTTNTNAGTFLRQVAFDKSVQRHLGSTLYWERIRKYQQSLGRDENDLAFSENDLLTFFKGEHREIKRYILDDVRDSITHNQDNHLKDFIDFGGRGKEKPLSYSSIEKTFYSFFIYQDTLDNRLDYKVDVGENPRQLEKDQIGRLMNIIAEEIYIGKFDTDLGTYQIEKQLQKGEDIPEGHLIAFRMSKEEILYNWLDIVKKIITRFFLLQGRPVKEDRLFQYKFPETLWESIRRVIRNLAKLSIWKNKELAATAFGGKQNYDYWHIIFESGKSPQGLQVLPQGINLDDLLKE